MIKRDTLIACAACIAIATLSNAALAAEGASTFESFYRPELSINWPLAGLAAVIVGVLVFIGLGGSLLLPGMPAMISTIGTSVGGLFGLSGAAATNAGLALLGGGSLAAGGFGVAGGTALLATALTFGTEVTLDYASESLISTYESRKFAEASLKMVTLPLPRNTSGPDSVKAAGKALDPGLLGDSWDCAKNFPDSIDAFQQCIAGKQKTQKQLVRDALAAMDANKSATSGADVEREAAMYALLHFLNNDYVAARKAAHRAYALGKQANGTPTLPAFILAASMLYDDTPDIKDSLSRFQYAIMAEPKNPLAPVLFSAYLDRLSYRLNDGAASTAQFDRISTFSKSLEDDERKLAIQQILLSHSLMQLKVAQQKVLSLTRTENRTILENPETPRVVNAALTDYDLMLKTGISLVDRQNALLGTLRHDDAWWAKLNPFKGTQKLKDEWRKSVGDIGKALGEYKRGRPALAERVAEFEKKLKDAQSWSLLKWLKGLFE